MTCSPPRMELSSHSRHSAVVGCVPVPKASPGSNWTVTASGAVTGSCEGQIHRRLPNRMAWKSFSHSRSHARSSIQVTSMSATRIPSAAPRTAAAQAASASPEKSDRTQVAGHKRTSPGKGSRTASSRASRSVTEIAPHSKHACSARSGSSVPSSNESCRKERVPVALPQTQSALEVVNVGAALLKCCVVEDLLMQRHVGLDPLDHHLGERILHAPDRGL